MIRKHPAQTGSVGKKVLLIDDEIESLREIIGYLKRDGWGIATAVDEKEAIIELERTEPSLVLLDLVLEKESGFEVLTQIRKTNPNTKVIIISKYFDHELIQQAMKAGAVGFIQKGDSDTLPSGFTSLLKGATV